MPESKIKKNFENKRILYGIVGVILLTIFLYIFYKILFPSLAFFSNPPPDGWGFAFSSDNPFRGFIIALLVSFFIFLIAIIALCIILLVPSYYFLNSAIKGVPLNPDTIKYIKYPGYFVILVAFLFGMIYAGSQYRTWNPHIGEYIEKNNVTFQLTQLGVSDQLDFSNYAYGKFNYACNDPKINATPGWKFLVYLYWINNKGNDSAYMSPSTIVDGSGAKYTEFNSECFKSPKTIPANDSDFGMIFFKIPMEATPTEFFTSINFWDLIKISLHKRWYGY